MPSWEKSLRIPYEMSLWLGVCWRLMWQHDPEQCSPATPATTKTTQDASPVRFAHFIPVVDVYSGSRKTRIGCNSDQTFSSAVNNKGTKTGPHRRYPLRQLRCLQHGKFQRSFFVKLQLEFDCDPGGLQCLDERSASVSCSKEASVIIILAFRS